jgi:ABC-type phosphate transport system substrate-binding protein
MRFKLRRYRRGAASVGAAVGATLIGLALAVPAGASTVAASNTVLNQGGSQTTYSMMQALSDLYNSSPGCNLLTANSANQELNYACASAYSTAAPGYEEGYALNTTSGGSYLPLNPYNDVVYEEAPMGSSNGIKALELEGSDTPGSAPDNLIAKNDLARSSRAAVISGSGDDKAGLNFVSYAADAVPWFHFVKAKGTGKDSCSTGSPSAAVTSLTNAQLTGIYEGTITNWSSVGGTSAPIDVYIAQSGSGTEGTWAADLGLTGTYPYAGVTNTASRLGLPVADFEIFENETSDIWANPAHDACDAIFFFSFGKYTLLCPGNKCADTPQADHGSKSKLGEINGVAANETTIDDQFTNPSQAFFMDRQLYNVYSDGSNANLPFANTGSLPPFESQAAQNFVSTYGFLCNPAEGSDIDPLSPTGATYLSEIDATITANGFFAEPLGVMGDSSVTTPPDPSQSGYDAGYAAAEPTPASDKGYCRISTTDGDGNN